MTHQVQLLKLKRFMPLFFTQFFGAFNDNIYKNALVILITYQLTDSMHLSASVLITIAAGIFILPFFLFSATAGQIADKHEKSTLIRYIKIAEIILMVAATIGFYLQSVFVLISVLFLLGTHAAFFGPLKYSILPDLLHKDELIAGNALLETGTFLAILLGTILGGAVIGLHIGPGIVSALILLFSIIGFITSLSIPRTPIAQADLKISLNVFNESWKIITYTLAKKELFIAILGISWFWLIGATYLSQFPTYVKDVLNSHSSVVTLFLTVFTAGIGVGSLLCDRLLKGKIHATYVPIAALGMTLFAIDLVFASRHNYTTATEMYTLLGFLTHLTSFRILFDLFLLAVCGGIYIVPLYAILQHESEFKFRSRALASNNLINALFMVISALGTSAMLYLHFSIIDVFVVVAIANLLVAVYICNLLPDALVKSFLIWIFKTLYRAEVRGLENYYQAGNRVLIVANHTSFLDAALLAALLPDKLTFAIDTSISKKWWISFFLKLVNTYSVDPTNALAAKSLIEYLREDHHVVIFPEGRITVTGALMKIYEGPGLIADKAEATLLPVRVDGAQYTHFSYLKGKVKLRWFPKITLTVLEPRKFELPETLTGRARREIISGKLYDIMTDTIFFSSNINETLFQSLLHAKAIHGKKHIILEDIERKPMNYNRLILSSLVLGRYITKNTEQGEYIGLLLPNSIANVVTFFGLQAFHRIPAMLNFTAGLQNILLACRSTQIRYVYTSRKFIELADLGAIAEGLVKANLKLVYLEDVRNHINIFHKLLGKLIALFPNLYYRYINDINKDNEKDFAALPAVTIFTSGSEGTPKGVVLSHANLQANRFQMIARVDFGPTDRVFNSLPMFHSFGLTTATLLPITAGIRVFMYPSPLHYRIIPELCYDVSATIFFGTETFLSNYAKYAHPYNFYSVRYVFAGAEKLRDETRKIWMQKFGIRIMEGYGVSEASPVISGNTSMQYKAGSVGRLFPGIQAKIEPVPGIEEGGRLFISGPNIMLGYLFADNPLKISPPKDGWHDTGDIVNIDDEGYIVIKGRAKRFAKIAGEMVSLAAVEEEIYQLWPDYQHAVMSRADERKGEVIVLATNHHTAEQNHILEHFKKRGMAEISLSRKIVFFNTLPVLGSGKIDYQSVKKLLEAEA